MPLTYGPKKTLLNLNKTLIFQYWAGMILKEITLGGVRQAYIRFIGKKVVYGD